MQNCLKPVWVISTFGMTAVMSAHIILSSLHALVYFFFFTWLDVLKTCLSKGYLHGQVYLNEDISQGKCRNVIDFLWHRQNKLQCYSLRAFEEKKLIPCSILFKPIKNPIGTFKLYKCTKWLDEAHLSPSPANWLTFNLINKPEKLSQWKKTTRFFYWQLSHLKPVYCCQCNISVCPNFGHK